MKHPRPDYVIVAFGEALRSLSGAIPAIVMVCMIGGAIPTVALWDDLPEGEDLMLLAVSWISHWVMAGMMIWGLLPLVVVVWCLAALLHGTRTPAMALSVALITQLFVSTVAICLVADEDQRVKAILASGSVMAVVTITVATGARMRSGRANAQPGERESAG